MQFCFLYSCIPLEVCLGWTVSDRCGGTMDVRPLPQPFNFIYHFWQKLSQITVADKADGWGMGGLGGKKHEIYVTALGKSMPSFLRLIFTGRLEGGVVCGGVASSILPDLLLNKRLAPSPRVPLPLGNSESAITTGIDRIALEPVN